LVVGGVVPGGGFGVKIVAVEVSGGGGEPDGVRFGAVLRGGWGE